MSQPAKRVAVSSVNWAKLAERLVPEHKKELDRLKMQNSSFHAEFILISPFIIKQRFQGCSA